MPPKDYTPELSYHNSFYRLVLLRLYYPIAHSYFSFPPIHKGGDEKYLWASSYFSWFPTNVKAGGWDLHPSHWNY